MAVNNEIKTHRTAIWSLYILLIMKGRETSTPSNFMTIALYIGDCDVRLSTSVSMASLCLPRTYTYHPLRSASLRIFQTKVASMGHDAPNI